MIQTMAEFFKEGGPFMFVNVVVSAVSIAIIVERLVVLGGAEIKFATNLLTALGRPDLVDLCRLPPGAGQEPVRDFLRGQFRGRTKAEWVEWFKGRDIAFAPVKNLREALDDPQFRAREMVLVDDRGWEHIGIPIKFTEEPGRVRYDLPALGQHSEAILNELGYAEADVARLREAKVIGTPDAAELARLALPAGG